jgi:hypothetical protein
MPSLFVKNHIWGDGEGKETMSGVCVYMCFFQREEVEKEGERGCVCGWKEVG